MGRTYSHEERYQAAAAYLLTRSGPKASEICGIPTRTITSWKGTDWWEKASAEIWEQEETRIKASCAEVIQKSFNCIIERLDKGDVVYVQGEKKLVPQSALTLAKVLGIHIDKLNILRGKPNYISGTANQSTKDRLDELKDIVAESDNVVPLKGAKS